MISRYLFTAAFVAVHSFTPSLATADPQITPAPIKRSHHDIARAVSAAETTSPLPLTDYQYPYSSLPEQVYPFPIGRGPQAGYNICNKTTEGPTSECQTLIVNSLADFCLWGSPKADGAIGDVEAAVVAYCSQPGHGTRVMPGGTITGAQFMKTSAYIQVTGTFDQTGIGLDANDGGGELDPHGADLAGNPLGGVVYTANLPSSKDNTTLLQATSWNNFVGSGVFCIKLCDPTVSTPNYCENRFDLLGCTYNMPASYSKGEFTSCEGDLQEVVGTYVSNGQTLTWSQPSSLPATSTLPWTPVIPASSNCQTFSSAQLYSAAATSSLSSSGSPAATTAAGGGNAPKGTTQPGSSAPGAAATQKSGAGKVVANAGLSALLGVVVVFLI